ncbi:LD-carboxypeptidase [Paucibacter sp. APW11]|uniref:LD-carboxypeptidase n=1 Tax=Roseateles aquae TaxID=3077235 RepID=A0ABU3PH08_9BURK|nr:LD-carboxypeptidase [Paucibacter sp. APW11]MDT9001860.1 LD-carboxypeptidase [Paucibacter sp. APW11]
MSLPRRQFAQTLLAAAATTGLNATADAAATAAPPALLRARRLHPGDTLGLVSPANASFEREPVAIAIESLQALGFKVKTGVHLRARYGHFAGSDEQRAADINAMFADDEVAGILALTGGSGCNRIVDRLDYGLIARKPKFFGGFSDLTCLVNAIQRQTGLITFHAPFAGSEWNEFSVRQFKAMVMDGEAALLRNPQGERGGQLVQTEDRISTLRGGRARGRLVGGNLAVLSSIAGSAYFPDCRGAILFLEEINEYIYRVDRMLSTLRLCGALGQLAGVVLGKFSKCEPGDGNYGTLTLDEVFDDYLLPLQVPVYRGAMIGHISRKFTVPVGAEVEIDADAGSIQLLAPAVRD